jgi:hypothetical protein
MIAGYTLTGVTVRSLSLRPAGLFLSLGCVQPRPSAEPSRTFVVSLWWGGVPLKNKRISAEKIFLIKGGLW